MKDDLESIIGCINALTEAIAISAFVTGDEKQVDAIVRILTDAAATNQNRHPAHRDILRRIAMRMHDERIRNAEWKRDLNSEEKQETPAS